MRIMPIKNRKPPRLRSAGSPVAAKGNAKMNSNSPRKNVRSGFQEDFGVETWTDKVRRRSASAVLRNPYRYLPHTLEVTYRCVMGEALSHGYALVTFRVTIRQSKRARCISLVRVGDKPHLLRRRWQSVIAVSRRLRGSDLR